MHYNCMDYEIHPQIPQVCIDEQDERMVTNSRSEFNANTLAERSPVSFKSEAPKIILP